MNIEWNRIRSFDDANVSPGAEMLANRFASMYRQLLYFFYIKYPDLNGNLAGFCTF